MIRVLLNRVVAVLACLLASLVLTVQVAAPAAAAPKCAMPPAPTTAAHPVLLVHGWNGSPMTATAALLAKPLKPTDWFVTVFDYHASAYLWAADPSIADCLADAVVALSTASRAAGGDGLVYVVGHSMGGLAVRFAAAEQRNGVAVATHIGGVVTLDTPHTGSPWGSTPYATILDALNGHGLPNPWATTSPDKLASTCLAVQSGGKGLPQGCAAPPYLDRSIPITQVVSRLTVKRTLFGISLYNIDMGGDSVVPYASSAGYIDSAEGGVHAVQGSHIQISDVGCTTGDDRIFGFLVRLGAAALSPRVAALVAKLDNDSNALDALLGDRVDPALLQFLAVGEKVSPCGHNPMTTFGPTITAIAAALPSFVDGHRIPTTTAQVSALSPTGTLRPDLGVDQSGNPADCLSGSEATTDGDALRCFSAHMVYDPCWAEAAGTTVVCMDAPWSTRATRLPLGSPLEPPYPDGPDEGDPWGLELAGGQRCLAEQGAHDNFDGRVVDYSCDGDVKVLRGIDRRAPSWQVDLARYTGGKYRATGWTAVAKAWYGESGPGGSIGRRS